MPGDLRIRRGSKGSHEARPIGALQGSQFRGRDIESPTPKLEGLHQFTSIYIYTHSYLYHLIYSYLWLSILSIMYLLNLICSIVICG
jgi:hypothetical protein